MKVTNTHYKDLALPNGQVVPAKSSISVRDDHWESAKHGDNVKAWLAGGYLVEEIVNAQGHNPDPAEGERKAVPQPRSSRAQRAEEG